MRRFVHSSGAALITLLFTLLGITSLSAATPTARATEFGVHQDLTYDGLGWRREKAIASIASLGAQVSRDSLSWADVEPSQGQRNWSRTDAVVDELGAAHIEPLFVLVGSPAWATGTSSTGFDARYAVPVGTGPEFQRWVAEYVDFVRDAVRRYRGRVERWELWNEENEKFTWQPGPSVVQYAIWYTAVHGAILQEDPHAKVALGGLAGLQASCCISGLSFLKQLNQLGVHPEIVAIHPYTGNRSPNTHVRSQPSFDDIGVIHRYLVGTDRPVKLWITEWGFSSAKLGLVRQAAYVAKSLEMLRDLYPYVDLATYFVDHDRSPEFDQGLFDDAYVIKPAGLAFRRFMTALLHRSDKTARERSRQMLRSLSIRRVGTRLTVTMHAASCTACRPVLRYRGGGRWKRSSMRLTHGYMRAVVHADREAKVRYFVDVADPSQRVKVASRVRVLPAARRK